MTVLAVAPALSLSSAGTPSAATRARLRERVARLYATRIDVADSASSAYDTAG